MLPFVNVSNNKDNEYFSDGITDEVIGALANIEGLRVVARTSSFAFKSRNISVQAIASELGVSHILEGSVQRSGNRLRVVAQLIDAGTGYHLWSKTYEHEFKDVFRLEDDLAHSIAAALRPKLLGTAAASLAWQLTTSTEAHDIFLQARFLWNKRSPAALLKAADLFPASYRSGSPICARSRRLVRVLNRPAGIRMDLSAGGSSPIQCRRHEGSPVGADAR